MIIYCTFLSLCLVLGCGLLIISCAIFLVLVVYLFRRGLAVKEVRYALVAITLLHSLVSLQLYFTGL